MYPMTQTRRRSNVLRACVTEAMERRVMMSGSATADGVLEAAAKLANTRAIVAAPVSRAIEDTATRIVRDRILSAAGMTQADAKAIESVRTVRAISAANVSLADTAYWSSLSAAKARSVALTIDAVKLAATDLNTSAIARVLSAAPSDTLRLARSALPVLMLPTPLGTVARFAMEHYDLLSPEVAAEFPEIKSVRLYGLDDTSAVGAATLTSTGLSAFITSPDGDWYVSPMDARASGSAHTSYFNVHQFSKKPEGGHGGGCLCAECLGTDVDAALLQTGPEVNPSALINQGATRRTLRLAFGATAEYTGIYGSAGVAFSSIVSRINTANVIYQRDFNVSLSIVSNTSTIYTNAATDGYTNSDVIAMLNENNNKLNAVYGSGAYDIGHVFGQATGISGVASLASVGQTNKGSGVSTANPLTGDYNVVVFHEMGHSLGAPHTFNRADVNQRSAGTAYEPGPGSTMMSYGSANLGYQGNFVTFNENYFHHNSIDRVENYLLSIPAVGTSTATGNTAPTANAGPDRTIPAFTAFELTGQAFDQQHNDLTYTWEQYDLGAELLIGLDVGTGPLFRSREGTKDTTRSFPELADVLANRVDADEYLPIISRTADPLTFRLTVKDQLGGVSDDVIDLPVVNTGAKFEITSQNSTVETWAAGSTQTISWNVAGTTGNGINTPLVDIYISYDGGVTFSPMYFGANNDGSQQITVPADAPFTANARVKVKGSGNYFFDINNLPIIVNGVAALNGLPTTAPASELPLYSNLLGQIADAELPLMDGANPNINFVGDTDTYLYSPSVSGGLIVTAGRVSGSSVDTVLSVYDDLSGVPLAINDDFQASTATSQVIVGVESGKRYRISVGAYNSATTGDVFLSIVTSSNNSIPLSGIVLNSDGDGSGTGTLISSRASNFHNFFVPSLYDGTGTISIVAPEASAVLSLYDASNHLLAFSRTGTFSSLAGLGLTPGSYYVRVGTDNYASGGGDYTLNINLGIDMPLPNTLTIAEGTIAVHAPTRTSFDAQNPDILIVNPDEVDSLFFAPVAPGLGVRGGTVQVIGGSLDPVVGIYNAATGARVALATGTGVGSTAQISNFVFQPGVRYIIAVSGLGNTTGNPDVRVIMEPSTQFPQSDVTLDSAGDGSAAFSFSANSLGQSFRIVAPTDATGFSIFQADPNATSDVELYLFDTAGNELATDRSHGPDGIETFAQTSVAAGTVFFATVLAQNYAGGATLAAGVFRVNFDTPAPPAAPPAPLLLAADDTGVSNSDRITRKNANLSIVVNAPNGHFVRLFRNGVQVAGPTVVGVTTFLALIDPNTLADGTYTYTATTAFTASGTQSAASVATSVTIDNVAPAFAGFSFRYDDGPADHLFYIDYTGGPVDLSANEPVVKNLTTNTVLPSSAFSVFNYANGNNDLTYSPTVGKDRVPSGNYEIRIPAGAVSDVAGNAAPERVETFFFLDGDANHDRVVDFSDLLLLAQNYDTSGRIFSQGDLNYDGLVNFDDLLVIAQSYGSSVFSATEIPGVKRTSRERAVELMN